MHILLVEDEANIARRTERLLREILGDRIERLRIEARLEAALLYLEQEPIDLLLLDLNLSGKNGFDILRRLTAESFATIIVSAYRDRALEAFEYGVLDFVPKPFDRERLRQALDRYLDRSQRNAVPRKFLPVKKTGGVELIAVADIRYIQGADIYTEIHRQNGRPTLSDKTLEALEQSLPAAFVRIHKSYIANMDLARELIVESGGKYTLVLESGDRLPVSRSRYAALRRAYFGS